MSKNELLDAVQNADNELETNSKSINKPSFSRRTSPAMDNKERASDQVVFWLQTEQCAPWEEHDRGEEWYNEVNSADLIESIKQKGDQALPGLVREIEKDKYPEGHKLHGKKYEIIYGARRHFACKHNGVKSYLAKLCDYDDKKCLALMHIENAQRKDISIMDRAKSIHTAYKKYWEDGGKGSFQTMANEYKEPKSTIHEYELAGRVWFINEVKDLFSDMQKIAKGSAMKIASAWEVNSGLVIDILNSLKEKPYFLSLSDSAKARKIVETIKTKNNLEKEFFAFKQTEFKDDNLGIIKGKVSESGVITIQLPPSAASINKKRYSDIIEKVMVKLEMRQTK